MATSSSKLSTPVEISALKSRNTREIECLRGSFVISLKFSDPKRSYVSNVPLRSIPAGSKYVCKITLVNNDLEFVVSPGDRMAARAFSN